MTFLIVSVLNSSQSLELSESAISTQFKSMKYDEAGVIKDVDCIDG